MPDHKPSSQEKDSTHGQHQDRPTGLLPETDQSPHQARHARNSEATPQKGAYTNQQKTQNWLMVVFTGLIFVVTCVYSYFSWGQWSSMNKALDETEMNRQLEYRAYVGVKGILFTPRRDNPAWGDLAVIATNSGRTPGLNGRYRFALEHRQTPLPEETILNQPQLPGSKIVFASQVDMSTNIGMVGTGLVDVIASVPIGHGPIKPTKPVPVVPTLTPPLERPQPFSGYYAYGVIEYSDIFAKSHWTKFCYFNAPGTSNWVNCPTFNDAQ